MLLGPFFAKLTYPIEKLEHKTSLKIDVPTQALRVVLLRKVSASAALPVAQGEVEIGRSMHLI